MAIDENKFILKTMEENSGRNIKLDDSIDVQGLQLEKLEKINEVLENIEKNNTQNQKIGSDNLKEATIVSNNILNSLTSYRDTLTNKNVNNKNINNAGGMVDFKNVSDSMVRSVESNTRNINNTFKKTNALSTNLGKSMQSFGHNLVHAIGTPVRLFNDIKTNLTNAMKFITSPIDSIKSFFGFGAKKAEAHEMAGVAKVSLTENKVMKNSAVGVATLWLYKQLMRDGFGGGAGGEKKQGFFSSLLDFGGKMAGLKMIGTVAISLFSALGGWPALVAAVIAGGGYYAYTHPEETKELWNKTVEWLQKHSKFTTDSIDNTSGSGGYGFSGSTGMNEKGELTVSTDKNLNSGNTATDTLKMIRSVEGNSTASAINKTPGNSATLGSYQWLGGKGLDFMTRIYNADPEEFKKHMGQKQVDLLNQPEYWKSGKNKLSKYEIGQYEKMMNGKNAKKYQKIDDEKALEDTNRYLSKGTKLGITDVRANMLFADAQHHRGENGAPDFLKDGTDFESIWKNYENWLRTKKGKNGKRLYSDTAVDNRLKQLIKLKSYNEITTGVDNTVTEIFTSVTEFASASIQRSFDNNKNLKYRMGGKGKDGTIDCSAFVGFILNQTMTDVNTALGKTVFDKKLIKGVLNTNAKTIHKKLIEAGAIDNIVGENFSAEQIRDGSVLTVDGPRLGYGTVDHIAMAHKNKDGRMMVIESAGGKGVTETELKKWLIDKAKENKKVHALDLYEIGKLAVEDKIIAEKQRQYQSNKQTSEIAKKTLVSNADTLTKVTKEITDNFKANNLAQSEKMFATAFDPLIKATQTQTEAITEGNTAQIKTETKTTNNSGFNNKSTMTGIPEAIMTMVFGHRAGGENFSIV